MIKDLSVHTSDDDRQSSQRIIRRSIIRWSKNY